MIGNSYTYQLNNNNNNNNNRLPLVVSHRGYSALAPENTIPSFLLAAEAGTDGIEIDIRITKDNQLVVIHDDYLNRTTNCTGSLYDYTYADLSDCDASYVRGKDFPQYRGTRIPLFSEVLQLAINYSIFVVIDYKSIAPIATGVKEVLQNYPSMSSQVIGSCWYPWQINDFAVNLTTSPKQFLSSGINTSIIPDFWDTVISSGVNGFSIKYTTISQDFIHQAHSRLLSVSVWTVNNETDMYNMISLGVDAILTDYPPVLVKIIQNFYNNSGNVVPDGNKTGHLQIPVYAVIICAVVAFAILATSVGTAIFFYRRQQYSRL